MPSNSEKLAQIKVHEDMPARPLGFYVLVEVVEVETQSSSGIYMGKQEREQSAEEVGYLRDVGPTAYHGWEGCKDYKDWGLELDDLVEFRAYEGKKCIVPGYERWRYIPDSHIVGVVNEVKKHSRIARPKDEGGDIRDQEEYA